MFAATLMVSTFGLVCRICQYRTAMDVASASHIEPQQTSLRLQGQYYSGSKITYEPTARLMTQTLLGWSSIGGSKPELTVALSL
jgi:C4-type Zn-finger protein